MGYNTWDLGECCCANDEIPICDGAFSLPGTLNFTDSILGPGTGTHTTGGPHDQGFGYWVGTLTVDFPGTGPGSPCGECPPLTGVVVTYRLIPFVSGTDCNFLVEIEIDVDDTQLCLDPGVFADVCFYDTTPFFGYTYTLPPAFSLTGSPACAGSFYITLVHNCNSIFDITWSQ